MQCNTCGNVIVDFCYDSIQKQVNDWLEGEENALIQHCRQCTYDFSIKPIFHMAITSKFLVENQIKYFISLLPKNQ